MYKAGYELYGKEHNDHEDETGHLLLLQFSIVCFINVFLPFSGCSRFATSFPPVAPTSPPDWVESDLVLPELCIRHKGRGKK